MKCDETKPSCLNCMKWRGYCDSYSGQAETPAAPGASPSGKLIHTKKAPLVIEEPAVNTLRFSNNDQRVYFDEWCDLSIRHLSGGLNRTRLWTATMPQVTLEEPTLRYGAMAIGALRKAYAQEGQPVGSALAEGNRHYLNALVYYCEALRLQSRAKPTREGMRTAMLSSLLFICFESQRANMHAALNHIVHGFSMLNELAACTDKAPDLVSIAPAPPSLVQEILDCYKPLELQSRSFMGSYKKFFFARNSEPSLSQPSPGSSPDAVGYAAPSPGAPPAGHPGRRSVSVTQTQSPPSLPGTPAGPLASQNPAPPAQTEDQSRPQIGLPSPQSQNSPQSRAEQPMPPKPQRPPGILPFTKHSPYFHPKQSNITSLDDLPRVFSSFDEAEGYWALLQKQMVQYIPILTMTTTKLDLHRVTDEAELDQKLRSVRQSPPIAKFIAESRYWLQRWIEAFEPVFSSAVSGKEEDAQAYLQAANMRIEYLVLYIYTAVPRFSGLVAAKGLTPQYREINSLAEALLRARPQGGFAMDSGWSWPLFVTSFGCRDPAVRADAMRILGQYPIRNALRDSRVFRAIALRNQQVEAETAAWSTDEQSLWLRLRRREVVFEDFGTSIIYRSAQRNALTNQWELVEEVADFSVQADGTLAWRRQPVSESTSIMSGVC